MSLVEFQKLSNCDLTIDRVYEGGKNNNVSDDPITKILPVGNMGGFRFNGPVTNPNLIVLYTDGQDLDWPDNLNLELGIFEYYGDNRSPGKLKTETKRKGNLILEYLFESLHNRDNPREYIPPIFIFEKHPTSKSSRSVIFRGLCVPGSKTHSQTEDLISIWKSNNGQRFENYKAIFSVLNCPIIKRDYIKSLINSEPPKSEPEAFKSFKQKGVYNTLNAKSVTEIRTTEQQLPSKASQVEMLSSIFDYFSSKKNGEYDFEKFAAEVYRISSSDVIIDQVTQNSVDGGRDALGRHRLGLNTDPVYVEFSLEAKLYNPGYNNKLNSIGVKQVSRLISRIRNRQYGVLVTTSVISRQVYQEVRSDKHPIIFISGKDIVNILLKVGINSKSSLNDFLNQF